MIINSREKMLNNMGKVIKLYYVSIHEQPLHSHNYLNTTQMLTYIKLLYNYIEWMRTLEGHVYYGRKVKESQSFIFQVRSQCDK